jgi:uncharacterized protein YggE
VATGVLIFRGSSTVISSDATTNTLYVSGEGSITVIPDVGYISLGVETKSPDVKTAEDENSTKMNAIIVALSDLGIEESDIKTTNYSIYPQYEDYNDEKPQNYVVSSTVEVTVKNLEDISEVIDVSVDAGANRSNSIRFDVLDREESYNEALQDAIASARARADVLAEAAGLKIVGVVNLNESSSMSSIYYGGARYAMSEMAADSAPAISTGDMEITANVSITYEVKNK